MKNLRRALVFVLFTVIFVCGAVVANAQPACTGNQILTAKDCNGDANSPEEKALFQLVNKYRVANNHPEIRLSTPLSMVANRRMLDLKLNIKTLTHSWSNCLYDIKNEKTWPCVIDAPQRLNSGYKGQGYETLYRTATGKAAPNLALEAWKKSSLHNSIILNLGTFKDIEWDEVGIAIDGQFAALWFGTPGSGSKKLDENALGLGVTYDQAVAGLSKMLSIDQTSSTIENNKWQGFSADKKVKLEIFGTRKEISEANLGITVKLEPNRTLNPKSKLVIATLLQNLFPEWTDRDSWFESTLNAITLDRTVTKTKIVRKIAIELKSDGPSSLKLLVKHESQPTYVEVF